MRRTITSLCLALTLALCVPGVAVGHPGGLDASGCHHDRQAGGSHCHGHASGDGHFDALPSRVKRDRHGRIQRSSAVRRRFLKAHGLTHTPTGCQVDHIVPLAKGGADELANLQLLCGAALEEKERRELREE